jgi:hypothetical protein
MRRATGSSFSAEARDHRLQHRRRIEAAEFDVVTRCSCDQFQKRELRPSVPLPERMDSIQLGETVSRCSSKSIGAELIELLVAARFPNSSFCWAAMFSG